MKWFQFIAPLPQSPHECGGNLSGKRRVSRMSRKFSYQRPQGKIREERVGSNQRQQQTEKNKDKFPAAQRTRRCRR